MATSEVASTKRERDDEAQSDSNTIRSNYSDTIVIEVGEARASFTIHKDLICSRSTFIAAAVLKGWKETEEQKVHLVDQQPFVFKAYIQTIYDMSIDIVQLCIKYAHELAPESQTSTVSAYSVPHATGHALFKLWVLGDYIGDTYLKNQLLRTFYQDCGERILISISAAKYLWDNTASGARLRILMNDCILTGLNTEKLDLYAHDFPPECLFAWLRAHVERDKATAVKKFTRGHIEKYLEV